MSERELTVGYLRKLMADLPDDTSVCFCDWDESHLESYIEQVQLDAGRVLLIPSNHYQHGCIYSFPIPEEWL